MNTDKLQLLMKEADDEYGFDKHAIGDETPGTGKRILNTLFNPLARGNELISLSGENPEKKALIHAVGLATGYGGLAYIAKRMRDKYQQSELEKKQDRGGDTIQSYIAAKYPQSLRLGKQAAEPGDTSWFPTSNRPGEHHVGHLALAVAATLAGVYGGTNLAVRAGSKQNTLDIDKRIGTQEQEIADITKAEFDRTRGLTKQAGPTSIGRSATSMYLLYAAGMMALSYKLMRDKEIESDPRRKRIKDLESLAKDQAKMRKPPILMDPTGFSSSPGALRGSRKEKDMSSVGVGAAARKGSGSGGGVDPNDPYAGVLG